MGGKESVSASDAPEVVKRRRAHFKQLVELPVWRDGLVPLFRELPAGACPLYFPLFVCDPYALTHFLEKRGLPAMVWWEDAHPVVPWSEFPEALRLKNHVVALPVHQEQQPHTLDAYCEALRAFNESLPN